MRRSSEGGIGIPLVLTPLLIVIGIVVHISDPSRVPVGLYVSGAVGTVAALLLGAFSSKR